MAHPTVDQESKSLRGLSWALWAVTLAGLLYLAGLTLWLGVSGLLFPYQLDYGEGVLLHFVREWAHGRPIYKGIEGYPYITANYPPLPIVLALALKPLLGVTYAAGRVWTFFAVMASAAIIGAWVQREGRRWLPAVAAALVFVGTPYVYHWAPLFRVDLVGLALTLGGLYAVSRAIPSPRSRTKEVERPWLLWLAVALFVAGLYAKQSFLFVDRRWAIKMAAGMAALGGGLFLLINRLTDGGFWAGLVASNVNPFLWPEFWGQLADFFGTFAVLGILTAWYLVDKFVLERATSLREKASPLDLYLVMALLSLGLAGKAGAWENYFFEALAALTLCGGLGLAHLARHKRWAVRLVAPMLVFVQIGLMWHTPRVADRYLRLTRQSNEAMIPILAGTPDPIISEDMGLLVTNDKVLDYYSFQYSQLARAGRWDQAWELGQLRDRRLSKIILERGTRLDVDRYQRFTRQFLSELDRNYRRAGTVGKYEIYEPDPLQHEQRVDFEGQLALLGWSLHTLPGVEPGDTISLTVVWQAQQPLATDYTAFAHLVGEAGRGWAGDDHQPYDGLYPTSAWGAGEMVRDSFVLTVPADAPPGLYDVRVGWYDPATQERLSAGEGNSFRVAVLPVAWTGSAIQAIPPLGIRLGKAITLEGYAWQLDRGMMQVTLRWSSDTFLNANYTVFVHLVDPENGDRLVGQGDAPPLDGRWPTLLWLPGMALDDVHTIPLAGDLSPGTYHLLVGIYDPRTGQRLLLSDGSDSVRLTGITVP